MWLLLFPLAAAVSWVAADAVSSAATSPLATAAHQQQGADQQIAQAQAGRTLTSLQAELHASSWFERPENRAGAHLRVAYWLAAGSRVGGAVDGVLLAHAQHASAQARAELGSAGVAGSPFATEAGQVDRILWQGQQIAEQRGRTDIAAQIVRLRTRALVPGSSLESWLGSPEARTRALLVAIPVVVGAGVLYWVMLPNLGQPSRRKQQNRQIERARARLRARFDEMA